jgi:hypothetical protein
MAVCGISILASGMTAAQIQTYIGDKLDQWATAVGQPLDNLISSSLIGTTISGLLVIGSAAASGINEFISWFCNEENITSNSNTAVIDTPTTIGGLEVARVYQYSFNTNRTNSAPYKVEQLIFSNGEVYGFYTGGMYYAVKFISRDEFTIVSILYNTDGSFETQVDKSPGYAATGWYYYVQGTIDPVKNPAPPMPREPSNNLNAWPADDTIAHGKSLKVIGGTVAIPHVGPTDKYFLDIDGVRPGDTATDAADLITGTIATGAIPAVSGEVAEQEPAFEITGPVAIPGLSEVFPFCIPFDIYKFLSALAADPVAPHFEWRFYVPGICDETIVIDLAEFNTIAQILRTMELLAFIVGLAFVTRSKMIRS